jgi:hypothetical protein
MFFIGGLNSVLPYIIYLSLIWVFLIVGFGGKILQAKQFLTPKTYYADNSALQYYDSKVFHYYQHTADSQKQKAQNDRSVFSWSCFYPSEIDLVPSCGYNSPSSFDSEFYFSLGLRGPPTLPFTI